MLIPSDRQRGLSRWRQADQFVSAVPAPYNRYLLQGEHVFDFSMSEHASSSAQAEPVSPAWAKTELARHPQRPHPMDFIERIFTDFSEIHGDRAFGDDPAMICGMARFEAQETMLIANLKGRSTKEKVHRRFGMPDPEGYRKALRAMKIAEKFRRPVITIIDIPAAYPGVGAEERGQAEAIARNMREMSRLRVPSISIITGEGGSGGALGLAVADRVLILESAIYSVIPPEGCAAILWRDASFKDRAAEAMRISADQVAALGCVDDIVPEPEGGAQNDPAAAAEMLKEKLRWHLNELKSLPVDQLVSRRYDKFRNMAQFYTA